MQHMMVWRLILTKNGRRFSIFSTYHSEGEAQANRARAEAWCKTYRKDLAVSVVCETREEACA